MRTKALLLGAMIGAASLATSMAQVYSVNIVGYVNKTIPAGFSMIQNPLNASPNNNIGTVIPSTPSPVAVYKWTGTTYLIDSYDPDVAMWDDDTMPIAPGEGFFIYNAGAAFTLTFVGEVQTGTSSTPLITGFNMVGSKVPQSGAIQADLAYVPTGPAEAVYKYINSGNTYEIYSWDPDVLWDPAEPTLDVADAVFIYRLGPAGNWLRTFNVGP